MDPSLSPLLVSAATIAFVHTLAGPDHYVPFVALARAGRWSRVRTTAITALCGVGHVLGSVVIGVAGLGLSAGVSRLTGIESVRAELAAWALMSFGLVYTAWGVRRGLRNRRHSHHHAHADGTLHVHEHHHHAGHLHAHPRRRDLAPWAIFIVFVLGPCEVLIPLLMVPALDHSIAGVALVTGIFGLVTLVTMVVAVLSLLQGARLFSTGNLERYAHAMAGLAILACGASIRFLGL